MQEVFAREIIDILSAAAQKAQILHAFDRAADQRIDRSHIASFAASLVALFARSFG